MSLAWIMQTTLGIPFARTTPQTSLSSINSEMDLKYEEITKSKKFLPFPLDSDLLEEHKKKAEIELNETNDTRKESLAALKHLIKKSNAINCPMNDEYLLQFLRARKFDRKKAYELLEMFYLTKKEYPECFDNIDYDQLEILAKTGAGAFLPYRSPDGCAVLLLEFNKWDCNVNSIVNVLQLMAILLLYAAEDPATQVCGVRVILNVKGATLRQISCISRRYVKLFSRALRNCMPNRFKGIHIFNESSLFQIIWSVLKLFLTEKIKQRVHFHSDNQKQLNKFIPKEILTEEYGGLNSDFNQGEWCLNMLRDFRPKIEEVLRSGLK